MATADDSGAVIEYDLQRQFSAEYIGTPSSAGWRNSSHVPVSMVGIPLFRRNSFARSSASIEAGSSGGVKNMLRQIGQVKQRAQVQTMGSSSGVSAALGPASCNAQRRMHARWNTWPQGRVATSSTHTSSLATSSMQMPQRISRSSPMT
eukprot:CAMPEP_0205915682 /NCGR_PEP_ID=MMETSP1325-20131115/8028_1 /ASSEMBLY_ACC=CAM_ASM_000708 /TAXON_ID=236786 /ORGANISM="Florenciella sp., Strain RCC1007" /LENGTH=148 /DNA_ID=CAMNT_0053282889 /DNA_START=704 /DNA_END=1150 /DNA_ORIENTATION=-